MSPEEKAIQTLWLLLESKRKREIREERAQKYKKTKDILLFLAAAGTCVFAPKSAVIFKPLLHAQEYFPSWQAFNKHYLKRTIARLHQQKDLKVDTKNGQIILSITKRGQKRIIKYALEELEIPKPKIWDQKWRLVVYDIDNKKKKMANLLRQHLIALGFLPFQESVFINPYPCHQEIVFLRSYCGLNKELHYMTVCELEDEEVFKRYFDLT